MICHKCHAVYPGMTTNCCDDCKSATAYHRQAPKMSKETSNNPTRDELLAVICEFAREQRFAAPSWREQKHIAPLFAIAEAEKKRKEEQK